MELIVDANVLLASFLKEAVTRELLLDSRLALFAPEHLITKIANHLRQDSSFRKRVSLSNQDLKNLFEILTQRIQTFPKRTYLRLMNEAAALAAHQEDSHYLALALHLNIPLWSNDKGFKSQTKVQVYSTSELIKILERHF